MKNVDITEKLNRIEQILKDIYKDLPPEELQEAIRQKLQKKTQILSEEDKGVVFTDNPDNAEDLAKKGVRVQLTTEQGVKYTVEEVKLIAKDTGKALAKALRELGEEIDGMKASKIVIGGFDIIVEYKNANKTAYNFTIVDDTLSIVDSEKSTPLAEIGVNPSGTPLLQGDVLKNEFLKYFRTLLENISVDTSVKDKKGRPLRIHDTIYLQSTTQGPLFYKIDLDTDTNVVFLQQTTGINNLNSSNVKIYPTNTKFQQILKHASKAVGSELDAKPVKQSTSMNIALEAQSILRKEEVVTLLPLVEQALMEVLLECNREEEIFSEGTNIRQPETVPELFLQDIEDKFGEIDLDNDFFSNDLAYYYKFTGSDEETGSRSHKVIKLPSFEQVYNHLSEAVLATKELIGLEALQKDRQVKTVFMNIVEGFNSLRSYLRKYHKGQYEDIKQKRKAAVQESLLKEAEEETPDKNPDQGEELPPTPQEREIPATPDTSLEDSTETLINRFPALKDTVLKLMTDNYGEFVESIEWISPRPSTFKINIKNGNNFTLTWTGQTFQAQIMGKRYYLSSTSEYMQALDKLSILYKEGPVKTDDDYEGGSDGATGGGGGDFPGGDSGSSGISGLSAADFAGDVPPEGGEAEEEPQDLEGEEIEFEEPGEEPKV